MVEAHTLDAWTRAADRSTPAFRNLTILGGLAAPLFLWLAGIAAVLSAGAAARRTGSRRAAAAALCRRGLEIFVLAFLFRLQAFVLSPGSPPIALLKVDILNIMGPALAATGLVWGIAGGRGVGTAAFGAIGTTIAMATPVVRAAEWVSVLPRWVQWYVRPASEQTTFTMFPWCGFVFAGAAAGMLIAEARDVRVENRVQVALGVAGGVLIATGFYTASLPSIHRFSSFWTSSPSFFAIRVGILLVTLSMAYWIQQVVPTSEVLLAPLERLGRYSLFVYWIHVELVYGYASWPMHRSLRLWQTAAANALFSLLLYGAVVLRTRGVELWRARPSVPSSPGSASV